MAQLVTNEVRSFDEKIAKSEAAAVPSSKARAHELTGAQPLFPK